MYGDSPYAQIPVYKPKPEQEKTCVIYERLQGTSKQEWMDGEESRYKRIRTDCTKIAKRKKEGKWHPI